jgi:DNA polymerase-3 subunit gamma/tau
VAEIARGGNGSMRDALSLLDQAIAYGGGRLAGPEVRAMLGTVDRTRVSGLLEAIAADDAAALFARVGEVAEFAPDFGTVLDELAAQLHRVQLRQFLGAAAGPDDAAVAALAGTLAPEDVQLLYQIAITGRRDLGMAPNPRAGFEMTLLRMLAFRPAEGAGERAAAPAASTSVRATPAPRGAAAAAPLPASAPAPASRVPALPPGVFDPPPAARTVASAPAPRPAAPVVTPASPAPASAPAPAPAPAIPAGPLDADRWAALLAGARLHGPLREFAHNVVPIAIEDGRLRLGLAPQFEHLRSDGMLRTLTEALVPALGAGLRIQVEAHDAAADTLAERQRRARAQQQGAAEAAIAADPVVQSLIQQFDARVVPQSTRPSQPE